MSFVYHYFAELNIIYLFTISYSQVCIYYNI